MCTRYDIQICHFNFCLRVISFTAQKISTPLRLRHVKNARVEKPVYKYRQKDTGPFVVLRSSSDIYLHGF